MGLEDDVTAAIYRAIDDVNLQLPAAGRMTKARDTVLFGREAGLDSLGLVNLIVALERYLERGLGQAVPLSTADMMLEPDNPFATVRSLEGYVVTRLRAPTPKP